MLEPRIYRGDIMIYRVTEYDLLQTALVAGNYYMCTDSRKMYKDVTNSLRQEVVVTFIPKENDRLTTVRPQNGVYYYVWDTNALWYYDAGWTVIDGQGQRASGYYYVNNIINPTDDVTVIDNNGLLADGSVVVRDFNRVVKGQIYINVTNDEDEGSKNELVISSFLNAGIKLLPNGTVDSAGTLSLSLNSISGEGRMEFFGDIYTTTDGETFYKVGSFKPVPESSSSTGNAGDIAVDDNYFYVCVAENTWRRTELSNW